MHEGHRARMKQRFFKSGFSGMESHQVLEMLLFTCNARGDTNPIAHRLLDKFGSLSAVFDAPYEELLKVEGIGPAAAYLIKVIPPLCGRYLDDKNSGRQRVFSIEVAASIFANKFIGYTNEAIALMLLDSKGQILYCDIVNEGAVSMAVVYVREIVKLAVHYNAVSALLAHNHPSGNTTPTAGDLNSTREVYRALESVQVCLEDHIIIGDGDFLSLANSGVLPDLYPEVDLIEEEESLEG